MKQKISQKIPTECPWRDTLYWYDTIDSTNTRAKILAKEGAPHGTVLIAGEQSDGRGRMGRSFDSKPGMGVYLSVILRPNCRPEDLMHLTCAAGVAVCMAIEKVSGLLPGIKWINDLVWNKKKLGGILTELSTDPKTGLVEYAVIGVGINCLQTEFTGELSGIATSLSIATGKVIPPDALAAAMVNALYQISTELLTNRTMIMNTYCSLCVTLGQDILIHRDDSKFPGKAIGIDDNGALIVLLPDGQKITVNSGEVSIRGMYGYI